MRREEKVINWLKKEIDKDKSELDREKLKFAEELKKIKKEDLFKKVEVKESIWTRLKKILLGG